MEPLLIPVIIPEHIPGKQPDHELIGEKLDEILKKYFTGKEVVVRCIGSLDHPNISLDELTNKVLESGSDRYDNARAGVGYKDFIEQGRRVDFYGEALQITKDTVFMPQQIWEMHHSAIGDRGYGVHVDLVLIYDRVKVEMVMNLYDDHPTSDGFIFKDETNKRSALLGLIKISKN